MKQAQKAANDGVKYAQDISNDLGAMVEFSNEITQELRKLQTIVHSENKTGDVIISFTEWGETDESERKELISTLKKVSNSLNTFFNQCQNIENKVQERQCQHIN